MFRGEKKVKVYSIKGGFPVKCVRLTVTELRPCYLMPMVINMTITGV